MTELVNPGQRDLLILYDQADCAPAPAQTTHRDRERPGQRPSVSQKPNKKTWLHHNNGETEPTTNKVPTAHSLATVDR